MKMKRLGVYLIVIVCLIACRELKSSNEMTSEDFNLNDIFPVYSIQAFEYSKIVDAVEDYITENSEEKETLVKKYLVNKLDVSSVFEGSFEVNYSDEVNFFRRSDILEYAIQNLSNSEKDRLYYMTQLLDQNKYNYMGSLKNGKDYIFIEDKDKVQSPYEIYEFGVPLLTADENRAIVLLVIDCGPVCGSGNIYLLSKEGSVWKVDNDGMVYIK
jgi:hypothetical protein